MNRTYRIWGGMKDRCLNPKKKEFPNYGGRGICVCEKWLNYEGFLEDMGEAPLSLTIERINTDGNYDKSNCKWATRKEQNNNTRRNRWIVYSGERKTVSEWADKLGLAYEDTYYHLVEANKTVEQLKLFMKQSKTKRKLISSDITRIKSLRADGNSVKKIASIFKCSESTIFSVLSGRRWGNSDV